MPNKNKELLNNAIADLGASFFKNEEQEEENKATEPQKEEKHTERQHKEESALNQRKRGNYNTLKKEQRNRIVNTRISENEYAKLCADAEKNNCKSISDYVYFLIKDKLK